MNHGTWESGSSFAALSKKGRAAAAPACWRCRNPSLINSLALGAGAESISVPNADRMDRNSRPKVPPDL
jgi:predicted amidohydrolase